MLELCYFIINLCVIIISYYYLNYAKLIGRHKPFLCLNIILVDFLVKKILGKSVEKFSREVY